MAARGAATAVAEVAATPVLERPLAAVGVSGRPARALGKIGIKTVGDLLFHLPRAYHDFSHSTTLAELSRRVPEGPVSAIVEILELRVEAGFRRRVQRTIARIRDSTGEGEAIWFGRRYVERRLTEGRTVALSGKVDRRGWLPRFQNPEFGPADQDSLHAGRIVPVYRLTAGVTLPWLRARIRSSLDQALPEYGENLPADVLGLGGDRLASIGDAIEWVHFPPDFARRDRALERLAFDELFALQLGMVARDRQRRRSAAAAVDVSDAAFDAAVATVESVLDAAVRRRRERAGEPAGAGDNGITLTDDQRAAIEAIRGDLGATRPMNRLLQGDVGSGKTAVAALALAFVAADGRQGALLAPTDLLARQHAETLAAFLEPLGHGITLLTGSIPQAARRDALDLIAAPVRTTTAGWSAGHVVVGTHALVQERVTFDDLALVVVDEQHRFGVTEREALTGKGAAPHVLLMTATPIPRTLGQIVHGDLDVSDLRQQPRGRQKIGTAVRQPTELLRRADGKGGALPLICAEVAAGHRAFVVVPLVEEDEAGATSVEEAAKLVRENWSQAVAISGTGPPEPRLEIVHGQMKAAERDDRMDRFRRGDVDILVGTTVLEVGVDVPEATVMLILDADRFGLAQLHQLRGRVGRGEAPSFCILVSARYPEKEAASDEEAVVKMRLDAVARTQDGFELAELDLEQRREGELLGLSQSGLPPLRVASLGRAEHRDVSLRARAIAEGLLDEDGRLPVRAADLERELTRGWLQRVGAGEVVSATPDA